MKKIKYLLPVLFAIFLSPYLYAQVIAIGHATAEVVEAVSASSATNDLVLLQQNTTPENLDLGNFTLNGGSNSICAVVVNASQLTSENGNEVSFTANTSNNNNVMNSDGSQVFNFKGNAGSEILSQNDQNYQGRYNVVFAYN